MLSYIHSPGTKYLHHKTKQTTQLPFSKLKLCKTLKRLNAFYIWAYTWNKNVKKQILFELKRVYWHLNLTMMSYLQVYCEAGLLEKFKFRSLRYCSVTHATVFQTGTALLRHHMMLVLYDCKFNAFINHCQSLHRVVPISLN